MIVDALLNIRASLEDPSVAPSQADFWRGISGDPTPSGVNVNESKAATLSAVWNAITVLSGALASRPFTVYRRVDEGRERSADHPIYRILHEAPNPEQTAFEYWEMAMAHALLFGNHYAEIQRNGSGRVIALWPLDPARTTALRKNGQKLYRVRPQSGEEIFLFEREVFHVPGLSFDGLAGKRVLAVARDSIGLALAAEEYANRFYGSGSTLSGVLEIDGSVSDEQYDRLRSDWSRKHSGLSNAHRFALLENGLKWKATGVTPEDSQFLESREFQIDEVARWFNVPPHKIKSLRRATFSNIEHQAIEFDTDSVLPWARRFEQRANRTFFPSETDEFYAEFEFMGVLRADSKARSEFYAKMFNLGAMSRNEIRAKENMNSVEGGDEFFVPANLAPVGAEPEPEPDPEPPPVPVPPEPRANGAPTSFEAPMRRLYEGTAQRLIVRECIRTKRYLDTDGVGNELLARALVANRHEHARRVDDFSGAVQTHAELVAGRALVADDVAHCDALATQVVIEFEDTSKDELADLVAQGVDVAAIRDWLDDWLELRAIRCGEKAASFEAHLTKYFHGGNNAK